MKNLIQENYKPENKKINTKIIKFLISLLILGFFGSFLVYKITLD